MAMIGAGVSHKGIPHDEWMYPFLLAASVVQEDVGKPMMIDTVNYTAKVATDGAEIIGWLESFEDRTVEGVKVGTIALKGPKEVPFATPGAEGAIAVGDMVVGAATSGQVKKAGATPTAKNRTMVVSKDATAGTVMVVLL